ncbi:MAG: DUF4340 domain-containing protein [Planctomycetota bacterium]|jgi:hypothetical protein|nr:DUF4340 domain-containing protein [Planctomycetota bacterium]
MHRRLAIGLSLAASLLSLFSAILSRREAEAWRTGFSRRLFPFAWEETVSVRLERRTGTLVVGKGADGEWRFRPEGGREDLLSREAADGLAALWALAWREPLVGNSAFSPAGEADAMIVAASAADGGRITLRLGGIAENLQAVTAGDDGTTYAVRRDILAVADWPAERFREMFLLAGGRGRRLAELIVAPAGGDPGLRLRIHRTPGGWRLIEPIDWPADEARLDALLRWADRLRALSVADRRADFGPVPAFVEALYDGPGGMARRRVEFGGSASGEGLLVAAAGREPIFVAPEGILAEISLDAAAAYPKVWRDFYRRRSLNLVGADMPGEIVVERLLPSPVRLILERDGDDAWHGRLETGGETRTFPVEPPDPAEPMRPLTALLTGLSSLRIQSFLVDSSPETKEGWPNVLPAWRFSCREAGGAELPLLTLYAAGTDGGQLPADPFPEGRPGPIDLPPPPGRSRLDGIAFSVSDQPALLEAPGEMAYLLCLPPYRYQSRRPQTMDSVDSEEWIGVEIAAGGKTAKYYRDPARRGEAWWKDGVPPQPLLDAEGAFSVMLMELSRLTAETWIADAGTSSGKFGLDRPEITAIVYTFVDRPADDGGGQSLKLSIGREAKDDMGGENGSRFARLGDSSPVFLISGRLAASLAGFCP